MAAKEKKLKRETATVNFGRSEAEEPPKNKTTKTKRRMDSCSWAAVIFLSLFLALFLAMAKILA